MNMEDPLMDIPLCPDPPGSQQRQGHVQHDVPDVVGSPSVAANTSSASALPRSIQWRLQLGLLKGVTNMTLEEIVAENQELVQQQSTRFERLMEKHVVEEKEEEEQPSTTSKPSPQQDPTPDPAPEYDPLTAMVMENEAKETRKQELYLRYRKERARRKRGLTTEAQPHGEECDGIDRASLSIIEKDLKRLPHPTVTSSDPNAPKVATPNTQEERISVLREILYIYSQEHTNMNYRQGMHEIASYLMFVLELEEPDHPDNCLFSSKPAICFAMLEATLEQLQTAYDASGNESLQKMSHSILSKLYQNDQALYNFFSSNPNIPPPPIYCTRWVRLCFSREVQGHENVLKLWDVFFEYPHLMKVLEVTCTSRILLLRESLLDPQHNPLDLLMNVPPMADITPLTQTIRKLMQQKESDEAIELPFHQLLPPVPSPRSSPMAHPLAGPHGLVGKSPPTVQTSDSSGGSNNLFNFNKMKETLNKQGESWKKKIMDTTNEWKQQQEEWQKQQTSGSFSTNSTGGVVGGRPAHRNTEAPPGQIAFSDPLLNPEATARRQVHSAWSKQLESKVLTIQDYLMSIEQASTRTGAPQSMENAVGSASSPNSNGQQASKPVPQEVWEALADIDRVQREIRNFSNANSYS